jgi:hypothetical protein
MEAEITKEEQQSSIVEWAVGRKKVSGSREESQLSVVKATPSGILTAIIDGMEHSEKAAGAAKISAGIFDQYTHQSITELFARCDKESRTTGGVSATAAIFNRGKNTVSWFGVGNVQGCVFHRNPQAEPRFIMLDQISGLVGDGQFKLREMCVALKPGDLCILASDGLKPEFVQALPIDGRPRQVADELLARYAREDADSLIIVVRFLG